MKQKWRRIGKGIGLLLATSLWMASQPILGGEDPAADARARQEKALAELKASLAESPDPAIEALVMELEKRLRTTGVTGSDQSSRLPPVQPSARAPSEISASPAGDDGDREALARAYVDWMLTLMPPVGKTGGFEMPREYRLKPRGDGYHVRLDPVILHMDNARIPIGPMDIQADPQADGRVRVRLKVNPHMTITSGKDEVAELTLGRQALESKWDPHFKTFLSLDWTLSDLVLRDLEQGGRAHLDALSMKGETRYEPKGPWRQDLKFQARRLRVDSPESKAPAPVVRLDGMRLDFSSQGRDLEGIGQITERLELLSERGDGESPETAKKIQAEFKALLQRFDAYSFDVGLTGLDVEEPSMGQMQLGGLRLAHSLTAADDKPGSFRMQFEIQDLKPGGRVPLPRDLTPTALNLDLSVVDLPPRFDEWLMELGGQAAASDDPQVEARLQQALIERLMQSGIGLVLRDSRIAFPGSVLQLDFDAHVAPQAAFQAVGRLNFQVIGLDRLVQAAHALGVGQELDQALAFFSALTERHKEGDRVIDRLRARVDEKGRIWFNDKDVTALFMPATQGAGPASAPPGKPRAPVVKGSEERL